MPESGAESVIRSGLPMSCLLQMKQEGFCNFPIHMSSFICFTFLNVMKLPLLQYLVFGQFVKTLYTSEWLVKPNSSIHYHFYITKNRQLG